MFRWFFTGAKLTALSVATVMIVAPALAQDEAENAGHDDWQFDASAYLFASAITGDVGVGPVTTDVDVSFGDILEGLEGGIMGYGQARKGPWSLIADVAYLKVTADNELASAGGALTANLDVELKQTILAGYGAFRVYDRPWRANNQDGIGLSIDVLGGARYNRVVTELDARAAILGLTTSSQRDRTVDWVDPVVGVRAVVVPARNWRVTLWGDYGGFDVGADSTWQLIGLVGYTFDNGIDLFGGYRAYAFDYSEGSGGSRLDLDLTYAGPLVGIGFQF